MPREDRYAESWSDQSRSLRLQTGDRCTLCSAKATQVHHAYYGAGLWHLKVPVGGWELPGWQIFPLCDNCHHHVHSGRRWRTFRNSWANRNAVGILWKLRVAYGLKFGRLPKAIAVAALGIFLGLGASLSILIAAFSVYLAPVLLSAKG